jgi:hypothetical protein
LAKFARIFFHRIESVIAIALMTRIPLFGFIFCHTLGTMQTNMISSRANFQLVLTLNSKKSIGADTMFPQAQVCGIAEGLEILSELFNQLIVLLSFTALSIIFACQAACCFLFKIFEFTNWAMETVGTLATFVSEKNEKAKTDIRKMKV